MKFVSLIALTALTSTTQAGGMASTTRYWDCSGGSCGCGYGNGSNPTFCSSNALFSAPSGNKWGAKFYGTAAVS